MNSRTAVANACAALSDRRVKASNDVPLITERVNVVSGRE
jgi:hypothetical protein